MIRLGLIGFGNIAASLLELLSENLDKELEHLTIFCKPEYCSQVEQKLQNEYTNIALDFCITTNIDDLINSKPNLVVECAGHNAVEENVIHVLSSGIDTVVISVGALSDPDLAESINQAAIQGNARLILPAGAIGGIDLLASLNKFGDLEVSYRGIKPSSAWAGTSAASNIDLNAISEPTTIFSGSAREAAQKYPKNANVAATIAMAGAGFDKTKAELIADPNATANIHEYTVNCPLASYTIRIEGKPSKGNAKTSATTVYSIMREISNCIGPIVI